MTTDDGGGRRRAREKMSLAALEQHRGFVDRHIGTSDDEQAEMLAALGYRDARSLDRRRRSAFDPPDRTSGARRRQRARKRHCTRSKQIAAKNRVLKSFIGQGYYGTFTPGVILRNVLPEPRVVHRLHALPAGNLAGTARGPAQLSDHGLRSDRDGDRQRIDARRSDSGGGGDDALPARRQEREHDDLRGRRRAAADDRRHQDAGATARHQSCPSVRPMAAAEA